MSRNKQRVNAANNPAAAMESTTSSQPATLSYVTPTEFVELPSRGRFYPPDHPLHNKEVIEMRYMTAKDEDILASYFVLLSISNLLQSSKSLLK